MRKLTETLKFISSFPIILLVFINLTVGLLTFRDYGFSWDEPLFYIYADSIKLAYTPQAFSPSFDFEQVYGPSATDHKYYGPAYILVARPVQQAVMAVFHTDLASAWHLVNFLAFQIGLIFFYFLVRRWFDPWPAAAAGAFFAWQPVMWGHAFINPKDMPFMVSFVIALTLGFWMVDGFSSQEDLTQRREVEKSQRKEKIKTLRLGIFAPLHFLFLPVRVWGLIFLAGIALGATTAIRVIGPLAGAAVFLYFVSKRNWRAFPLFIAYGFIAILVMFVAWPFLWADPINRLLEVLRHMSNNPTELAVLFMGQVFHANDMPRRYLPQLFSLTLTEPTWLLFFAGLLAAIYSSGAKTTVSIRNQRSNPPDVSRIGNPTYELPPDMVSIENPQEPKTDRRAAFITLGIFVFMLAYLLYNKPSVYDGYRHFLFIVPPVFVIAGFAFQWLWEKLKNNGLIRVLAILIILLPGVLGIIQLHPYEYSYYNSFTGGVGGAYRSYETEYWLTCYKESLEWIRANEPGKIIHIQREFPLAAYYGDGLNLKDLGLEAESDVHPGDLLLFSTRADLDIRSIYRKVPVIHAIGRQGADFCLIKQKE